MTIEAAPTPASTGDPRAGSAAAGPVPADQVGSRADGPSPASPWRDRRKWLWLLGMAAPSVPIGAWLIYRASGAPVALWSGPIWVFVLVPVLDIVVGTDTTNPPSSAMDALQQSRYYRWCTYGYLPVQLASLVVGTWAITHDRLSVADMVGLSLTIGMVGGIAVVNAHELGHRREAVERWLSRVVLAQSCYGHFFVEHNRGHHSRVATPEDPASARMGESFWAFLPRTVAGGLRSGWAFEADRLRRLGHRSWSPRNRIVQAWAMSAALYGTLVGVFGPRVAPFAVVQVAFAVMLVEVVNYLEHYGLLRRTLPSGRYERCLPEHSWNSDHVASNLLLYNLERHSDHHANPTRRFQTLRHFDSAPELPHGYGTMIVLALVPPLWRRVMDARLVAHYAGDVTRANIHPRRRAAVLRRFSRAYAPAGR